MKWYVSVQTFAACAVETCFLWTVLSETWSHSVPTHTDHFKTHRFLLSQREKRPRARCSSGSHAHDERSDRSLAEQGPVPPTGGLHKAAARGAHRRRTGDREALSQRRGHAVNST